MASIPQKLNNLSVSITITLLFLLIFSPKFMDASIYKYDPDIDIALGDNFLIVHDNGNYTVPGSYIGVFYIMESPLLKNLFSTSRFYSLYNLGVVFFNGGNNDTILFLPFSIDIGYKFKLFKRFELIPYAGWGFGAIPKDYPEIKKSILLSLNAGLLIRYKLWNTTYLKVMVEYGTIFGNQFPNRGYANYIKIIYPIPFIP